MRLGKHVACRYTDGTALALHHVVHGHTRETEQQVHERKGSRKTVELNPCPLHTRAELTQNVTSNGNLGQPRESGGESIFAQEFNTVLQYIYIGILVINCTLNC